MHEYRFDRLARLGWDLESIVAKVGQSKEAY